MTSAGDLLRQTLCWCLEVSSSQPPNPTATSTDPLCTPWMPFAGCVCPGRRPCRRDGGGESERACKANESASRQNRRPSFRPEEPAGVLNLVPQERETDRRPRQKLSDDQRQRRQRASTGSQSRARNAWRRCREARWEQDQVSSISQVRAHVKLNVVVVRSITA